MRNTPVCSRVSEVQSILVLAAAVWISDVGATALHGQPPSQSTIQGRLLDENKRPIGGITLSVCQSVEDPGGSVGTFFTADAKGSVRAASVKERGSSERTFFIQDPEQGWMIVRTQDDGRFAFEGEFAPGSYCLAADVPGSSAPRKLSAPGGQLILFKVSAKPANADLGDVVVKR